jgi:hypothetical protein
MSENSSQMRQVLGFFWPGTEGAHTPGGFVEALIRAVCKADVGNQVRLQMGFPAVVWAVQQAKNHPSGRELILAEITNEEEGPL